MEKDDSFGKELNLFMNLTMGFFLVFSITLEVFFRRKFGERYFSSLIFFGSLIMFSLFISFAGTASALLQNPSDGFIMWGVLIAFVIMSIVRKIAMYRLSFSGEKWHSRCAGISYSFLGKISRCSEDNVQLYIEPLFGVLIALAVSPFSNALSAWLLWASISLFAKGRFQYAQERTRYLDTVDGQIESEQLAAALVENKPRGETSGFSVVGAANQPLNIRKDIANHFKGLDKSVKDIIEDH